ncbi:MAG: MlaE family lipid ABC transporter permease subunit [Cyanobacteria bacterium P01_H01_bin.15]
MGAWLGRLVTACFLTGQVLLHFSQLRFHRRNTLEQMAVVGPESLLIALVTGGFVGMVFTIQVAREFIEFGASATVGGVLGLALARELAPVLTAVILAGRVGSAFAAEIGTMRVTEQIDALYVLRADPVDYLVMPRVLACCLMLPLLTLMALIMGLMGGMFIANALYDISTALYINSVRQFLDGWDIVAMLLKAWVFGSLVAIVGCNWGLTTTGGAKGVGRSTTSAVVTTLLAIFVSNFFLSWALFKRFGQG